MAEDKLKALNELQRRLALDESTASAWIEEILQERLAFTNRGTCSMKPVGGAGEADWRATKQDLGSK